MSVLEIIAARRGAYLVSVTERTGSLPRRARVHCARDRCISLSHREREVMAHAVAGHLNERVGVALGINAITVKAPRGEVMRKWAFAAAR